VYGVPVGWSLRESLMRLDWTVSSSLEERG
jgi:hypothetical protein